MPMTNFQNGFDYGVTLRGMPVLNSYGGNVYWVDSGSGANTGDGTFDFPYATIDYAIGRCTANNGDVIMVKPGHSEAISTADIDLDVAGVTIVGLGNGSDMPEITYTGTTDTTTFDASADNCAVYGLRFLFDDNDAVDSAMVINGDNVEVAGCEFVAGANDQPDTFITVGVADGDADDAYIHHNRFVSVTAGANSAILLAKDHVNVRIEDNIIDGDWADGGISGPAAGDACTALSIRRNYIRNLQTGDHAIELTGTSSSGVIADNRLVTDTQTAALDAGACSCMGNLWNSTAGGDSEGVLVNAEADSATNFIGADDSNNAAATTNVTANADGSILERLEYLQATGTAVPSADAVTNTTDRDVVGNKTDASVYVPGTQNSLAAYAKGTANLQERVAAKTAAVMVDNDVLFTIAGGPIKIEALWSECVTGNDGTASTVAYKCTPTTGSEQTISAASASLANAAAGASVALAGTALTTAALYNANGPNLIANPGTIVAPIGTIGIDIAVGSTTGTWRHFLRYKPLAVGVTVS